MNGYDLVKLGMLMVVLEASHTWVLLEDISENTVTISADGQKFLLKRVFIGHRDKTVEDLLPLMEAI